MYILLTYFILAYNLLFLKLTRKVWITATKLIEKLEASSKCNYFQVLANPKIVENVYGTKKEKLFVYFVYVGGVLFSVSASAVISPIGLGDGVDAIV